MVDGLADGRQSAESSHECEGEDLEGKGRTAPAFPELDEFERYPLGET